MEEGILFTFIHLLFNQMKTKLNVLLAKTDLLATSFRASIQDYIKYFNKNQGDFKGERKTYECKPGMIDIPTERGEKKVVTTIDEKLNWLQQTNKEYIDALFSQEATNASGTAKATLIIAGKSWGEFSSLELLRLKSLIENGELDKLYQTIPTRSDSEIWEPCDNEQYQGRALFQSPIQKGIKKSITKENYILTDPNINKENGSKYTPQVSQRDTIIELGDYTYQRYSGEWSHRQRAELLRRKQDLIVGVTEALKVANDVEVVTSSITSDMIFNYLHQGN